MVSRHQHSSMRSNQRERLRTHLFICAIKASVTAWASPEAIFFFIGWLLPTHRNPYPVDCFKIVEALNSKVHAKMGYISIHLYGSNILSWIMRAVNSPTAISSYPSTSSVVELPAFLCDWGYSLVYVLWGLHCVSMCSRDTQRVVGGLSHYVKHLITPLHRAPTRLH
jgi:hypothetical protein